MITLVIDRFPRLRYSLHTGGFFLDTSVISTVRRSDERSDLTFLRGWSPTFSRLCSRTRSRLSHRSISSS